MERLRHNRSYTPKGSYHSYCRQKLSEIERQNESVCQSTRNENKLVLSNRKFERRNRLESAQSFQQYLLQVEQDKNSKPNFQKMQQSIAGASRSRKMSEVRTIKKIQNAEIVETILPFFKCKLPKSELLVKKAEFRMNSNKFKRAVNIVESNVKNLMSHSLPIRNI